MEILLLPKISAFSAFYYPSVYGSGSVGMEADATKYIILIDPEKLSSRQKFDNINPNVGSRRH